MAHPRVIVEGSKDVDVALMERAGKLAVHLVNTSGPHADTASPIHDSIAPVGPLTVRLRVPGKPGGMTLEPGGEKVDFEYADGEARVTVLAVAIHRALVVE
jgi:hypothetical protein